MSVLRKVSLFAGDSGDLSRGDFLKRRYNLGMGTERVRRWMQFSIRTMLLLVVAASLPLAWLASKRSERRGEQRAAIAIQMLGGHVRYNSDDNQGESSPGPRWLRSILGDDFFAHVAAVSLRNQSELIDADLEALDSLPYVEDLSLDGTSISDAGLLHLRRMTRLTYLDLGETRVSDAGVAVLKRLCRLERLELQETLVTGRGVAELQTALPNCNITRYARASDDEYSSRLPLLHDAAKAGDIERIRDELMAGVLVDLPAFKVNHRGSLREDWDGTTPLMWAATRGQTAAVRTLIEDGADVNVTSSMGVTALMAAAGAISTLDGDPLACVEALLAAGAKVDDTDNKGRSALFYACGKGLFFDDPANAFLPPTMRLPDPFRLMRPDTVGNIGAHTSATRRFLDLRHGDARRVKALLAASANVNAIDQEGDSVLTTAAYRAEAARVRLLLAAGANANARSSGENSTLRAAGRGGDFETFKLLLDAAAEPDLGLLACAAGSDVHAAEKVKLLLDRGADPNESGAEPEPPLLAALWGNSDAATLLIRAGARTDFLDVNRLTAIVLAARNGPAEAVRLLLEQGFDPNERSEYWYNGTVLIVAAGSEREAADKVRHLIAAGADLEAKDDQGRTALWAASEIGNMEAVVVLAEAGADADVVAGRFGMTPLQCVASRGADVTFMCEQTGGRAARALLIHGADPKSRDEEGRTARILADAIHHDEVLAVLDEFGG